MSLSRAENGVARAFVHIAKKIYMVYREKAKNDFVKKIEIYCQNARKCEKGIAII